MADGEPVWGEGETGEEGLRQPKVMSCCGGGGVEAWFEGVVLEPASLQSAG